MKIALTAMMTAVATGLLVFAQPGAAPIDVASGGNSPPALAAQSASIEGDPLPPPPPQTSPRLPRSKTVSYGAADAAPPVPPAPPDGRAAYLQELVEQARQQNEQLAEIDDELAARRRQAAEEESERQAEAEQESAQHAATLQALDTLRRVEEMLAFGNSDGVDEELANASGALWGRTRLDVEAAREALSNEDLFLAREYLAAALAERRRPLY